MAILQISFNSLLNIKILDVTKLKAFADNKLKIAKMIIFLFDRVDNKLNIAKMMIFLFDRVEKTVGKGENAGYQHFLLFLQCFPKTSLGFVW